MKNKIKTLLITIVSTLSIYGQGVDMNGYVRTYIGVMTNDSLDYSIVQNTLDLSVSKNLSNVGLVANTTIYQYPNQELSFDLNEVYMDIFFDNMDLRIGRQQIIWGKADGVFITDLVSPKDLSEFLLRDFSEIRTAITSVKADYYLGNGTFELVWIPVFVPTQMPDETSIWSRVPTFPIPTEKDYSLLDIPDEVDNGELFVKYSGMSSLLDFEVMAGTFYEDDATIHLALDTSNPAPSLKLTPQHHRLNMLGGSFSTNLLGKVFRGEGAYYTGKVFQAMETVELPSIALPAMDSTIALPSLMLEKDYLYYLLGLDFNIGQTKLSTQFIQKAILDYDESLVADEFDNTVTILVMRTFLRETLTAQLFSYIGLNNEDALIRPTLSYDFADGFELTAGANIFYRNDDSEAPDVMEMFGYFDENDMVYLKAKFSF